MKGNLYLITNKINDKVYVGKTYHSIEKRFKQHISESRKDRSVGRDLYDAMRYFGVENFQIQLLGVFEEGILEEKEMEYIKKYDSYKNGYNQTLGGDGKRYICFTDEEAINVYKKYNNLVKASKELNCSRDTLKTILKNNNVEILLASELGKKPILCSNGMRFDSITDGAKWVSYQEFCNTKNIQYIKHGIRNVLSKRSKTYLGLTWSYEK